MRRQDIKNLKSINNNLIFPFIHLCICLTSFCFSFLFRCRLSHDILITFAKNVLADLFRSNKYILWCVRVLLCLWIDRSELFDCQWCADVATAAATHLSFILHFILFFFRIFCLLSFIHSNANIFCTNINQRQHLKHDKSRLCLLLEISSAKILIFIHLSSVAYFRLLIITNALPERVRIQIPKWIYLFRYISLSFAPRAPAKPV